MSHYQVVAIASSTDSPVRLKSSGAKSSGDLKGKSFELTSQPCPSGLYAT